MTGVSVRLRPVVEDDLAMFRRFATEPVLIGLDWGGFRDANAPVRRFAADGYLGEPRRRSGSRQAPTRRTSPSRSRW